MGTCQFAMLLHTAVWLSTSAPFPLTDVRPGICVRARRGLHVGQPGPRDPPRRHREHVVSTAQQGKRVRSQRRDLGAWWERHWWDSDRRSTLFATPSARVSPILSHLRNSKFGHERCVFVATSWQSVTVIGGPAYILRSTVRAFPPVCSNCRVPRNRESSRKDQPFLLYWA